MVGIAHTPRSQLAQRWHAACQESAQANGQIVNVKSDAELTCQTDYISYAPGLHLADGRTHWLTGRHVLWHRVAFRFHCQLTLLQLHSAMVTATILAASRTVPHSGQIASASLFYGLVAVAAAYCFRFASMWQPRSARCTFSTLFTRPVLSLLQIEIVLQLCGDLCLCRGIAGIGTGPAALPLINCQRKLIST